MATEESDVSEFRAVVTLVSLTVAALAYWNAMPFLIGGFVDKFGWSPELAGRVSSVQLIATMTMLCVATVAVHRWNLRTMVLFGALVAGLSDLCAAWLENEALVIMTRVVAGLSGGVVLGAVFAAASRVRQPTRVYGIVVASMSLSGLVWFFSMPWLLENTGMKGPFLGLATVSLIAFAVSLAWFPRFMGQRDVPSAQLGLLRMLTAPVLLLATGLFVQATVVGAYWAYWERIGINSELSAQGVGLVFALGAVSGMLGGALAAWLDGKVGDATALIAGFSILAAGYAMALFYNPAAYVSATIISYLAGSVVLTFVLGMFAKVDSSGRLANGVNVLYYAGGAVGPAAASLVLMPGNYDLLIYVGCVGLLASLVLIVPALMRKGQAPNGPALGLGDHT